MNVSIATTLDIPKPSLWPINMARFGETNGKPIYRIVFAPTVYKLVFGQFIDGYVGARARRTHLAIGNKWILEKWISGYEDTKMTPAEYERWGPRDPQSGMLINGPYPYDGVYNHCWTFESAADISGVDKIIGMIQMGAKRTYGEIKANNKALDEKAEKEAAANRFLRCREAEPLYGIRPASFRTGPKSANSKSARLPIAANSLGFPTRRGSVMSMKGPKVNIDGNI